MAQHTVLALSGRISHNAVVHLLCCVHSALPVLVSTSVCLCCFACEYLTVLLQQTHIILLPFTLWHFICRSEHIQPFLLFVSFSTDNFRDVAPWLVSSLWGFFSVAHKAKILIPSTPPDWGLTGLTLEHNASGGVLSWWSALLPSGCLVSPAYIYTHTPGNLQGLQMVNGTQAEQPNRTYWIVLT